MNYSYDIFLSYSAKDREFAEELATDLTQAGFRVWLDHWAITAGSSIASAIDEGLSNSALVLSVMSPDYFQSAWTQREWQSSMAREISGDEIKVVPLLFRDSEIPSMLATKQWVDFRNPSNYRSSLYTLIGGINSILKPKNESRVEPKSNLDDVKPGERIGELDPKTISALKSLLEEALEPLKSKSELKLVESVEEDLCFVIMPFSVAELNYAFEDHVRPTLEDRCKLRVERGDDVFGSNVVMDDISKQIQKARIIVADLTGRNANVFYEVGIAHALNKQVLLMTQSIDDVPFDLRYRRALVYEYTPRGVKKLEKDLFDNVTAMLVEGT